MYSPCRTSTGSAWAQAPAAQKASIEALSLIVVFMASSYVGLLGVGLLEAFDFVKRLGRAGSNSGLTSSGWGAVRNDGTGRRLGVARCGFVGAPLRNGMQNARPG